MQHRRELLTEAQTALRRWDLNRNPAELATLPSALRELGRVLGRS